MPTYGYECNACSDQFEIMQSVKDNPLTTCEKCGGNLRKLIYPVGIAFKGSGFYVNDYAAKPASTTSAGTASAPTDTPTPASTDTKSEATPATPTATESKAPAAAPTPATTPA